MGGERQFPTGYAMATDQAALRQKGRDRAEYGALLLWNSSDRLRSHGLANVEEQELRRFRRFYLVYPQIRGTPSPEFKQPGHVLTQNLSFSHFSELIEIESKGQRGLLGL